MFLARNRGKCLKADFRRYRDSPGPREAAAYHAYPVKLKGNARDGSTRQEKGPVDIIAAAPLHKARGRCVETASALIWIN